MTAARDTGADAVLARSRFTADMPALFQRYARLPDTAALAAACAEPLRNWPRRDCPVQWGNYCNCHDALEEAWRRDERPGRELYQGLLQVGIAYYQIERGNTRGALKMLLRAVARPAARHLPRPGRRRPPGRRGQGLRCPHRRRPGGLVRLRQKPLPAHPVCRCSVDHSWYLVSQPY